MMPAKRSDSEVSDGSLQSTLSPASLSPVLQTAPAFSESNTIPRLLALDVFRLKFLPGGTYFFVDTDGCFEYYM